MSFLCEDVFLVLPLLIVSCNIDSENTSGGMKDLTNTMHQFRQAVASGDSVGAAELWTEDALFLPNGYLPISGPEVRAMFRTSIHKGFRIANPSIIDIDISGDIAYEVGCHQWTMIRAGSDTLWKSSKYLHIWKKQENGSWKLYLDIWNNDPDSVGE